MHPSVVLAAVFAAAGASLPAYAQPDPAPHACVRKDGAPLPSGAKDPDAPFDPSSEALAEDVWSRATAAGVRLGPDTCRLLAADGHALTRREVEALKGKAAPNASKSKATDAKRLEAARAALDGSGIRAAAGTYEDSKRRFDGAAPGGAAGSAVGAGGAAVAPVSHLSAALNSDLRAKYAEEEAGRGLLAHFTDAEGTVRLPGVGLVDYGEAAAATYDAQDHIIHLNQREAAKAAVSSAPEAERPALAKRLTDPAKLSAYLVEHPEARAALLDQQAGTFFHETFHAWQQRRDPPVEAAEGKDPVEWEREAFREELRYFHQRVMRDPALADRSPDTEMYKRLLAGYPEFKSYVTELYQSSFGSGSFDTVEQVLAKRAKAGRPGAAGGLAALRQDASDYRIRETDFAEKVLPAMQAEAYPKLIARQLASGRPIEALALAFEAPEEIRRSLGPAAFAATRRLLEADPPAPVAERIKAWDAYLAYQTATAKSNELEPAAFALYQRDRRAAVELRLAEAARARTKEDRAAALAWAKSYASELPEKAELLKRIASAGGGKTRVGARN